MSVEEIESAAEWAGLDQTAEWYRRVAKVLGDFSWYDAAIRQFETSLDLDPGLWRSKVGIAQIYKKQKKYDDALKAYDIALKLKGSDDKTPAAQDQDLAEVYRSRAECYKALIAAVEEGNEMRAMELLNCVLECYRTAFSLNHLNLTFVDSVMDTLLTISKARESEDFIDQMDASNILTREGYLEQVMQLLHQLDGMETDGTTNLIRYLHDNKYSDGSYAAQMASVAVKLGQLPWLQSKYRDAIAHADRIRQPVVSANLTVSLGRLYAIYGDQAERGARLWEAVGTERITSTALASDIGFARTTALTELGQHCIRKALQAESIAEQYISKMEWIAAKRRYGARIGTEDSVPANNIALYLGAWYRKTGRMEEAREVVKPHMQDALIILSDDDPYNDDDGYWDMSRALVALGDTSNALAMYYALREYEDGVAVIEEPDEDDEVSYQWVVRVAVTDLELDLGW
jgi:tetratricopeptide (TPR) repeat protein